MIVDSFERMWSIYIASLLINSKIVRDKKVSEIRNFDSKFEILFANFEIRNFFCTFLFQLGIKLLVLPWSWTKFARLVRLVSGLAKY